MYQCVAIGNALLDKEFLVDKETLVRTGLQVGQMTLTDLEQQHQLLFVLKKSGVSPKKQSSGGSAANTVAAFASLGGKAYYHCRVGHDEEGALYLADLACCNVTTNASFAQHEGTTGSCAVLVGEDGERTMQTFLGVSSTIDESSVDFETLVEAQWLYLEGYLAMSPSIAPAIQKLRQQAAVHGVKVAISFADPAVVQYAKEGLEAMIGTGVHAIFCNLEEAKLFTGKKQAKACLNALSAYAKLVVITQGASPTLIAQDGEVLECPVPTAVPLDTNGAGDNYAGAFLYGLSQHYSLQECAKLASAVACKVVQVMGARLAKDDYIAIKNQVLGS